MLISAILCFIDQRLASFLYHRFCHTLQIHKRCFSKIFCTTLIVVCQIISDKKFSFAKKSQPAHDQTEMTCIENTSPSITRTIPSFNLHSNQFSTPSRPTSNISNFKPKQNIRFDTSEIEIHAEDITNDTENSYHTAREMIV
jgi:hypothetical protein